MRKKIRSRGTSVFLPIAFAAACLLSFSCGKSEDLSLGEKIHQRQQRALLYYEEGDYGRCIEELRIVFNLDPDYSPARDLLSEAKNKLASGPPTEKSEEAEELFREALRWAGEPGKLRSAILKCREALECAPDHGLALLKLKKWTERLEERMEEHYQLGSRHFKYGNYARAIEQWNIVTHLALQKSDPLYRKAEEGIGLAREKVRK